MMRTLAANEYSLSIHRNKEVAYEAVEYDSPKSFPPRTRGVILSRLANVIPAQAGMEEEGEKGRKELEGMLK